jgi:hypothetical protein
LIADGVEQLSVLKSKQLGVVKPWCFLFDNLSDYPKLKVWRSVVVVEVVKRPESKKLYASSVEGEVNTRPKLTRRRVGYGRRCTV